MKRDVRLLFAREIFNSVQRHLFRADNAEHAGVLLCSCDARPGRIALLAREFRPARDGIDYTVTAERHGRLEPLFIESVLSDAKDQNLAYIAIHNHYATDRVSFSDVDFASHDYGYPTLLALNHGLPIGAAVFGTDSVEVDLWMPDGTRHQLETARVIDRSIRHLWADPTHAPRVSYDEKFARQLPFVDGAGQGLIGTAKIGIVGLGGLGSQLVEPLVRLGLRHFVVLDPDRLDQSNYSRLHGSQPGDLPTQTRPGALKVEIAKRSIQAIAPDAIVDARPVGVTLQTAHQLLRDSDFVFLAADTAEARLACNVLTHQHYIPMVQIGTKVVPAEKSTTANVFGVVRHVRPGSGCLWCNGLVDRAELADVGKTRAQKYSERYGTTVANPSVVTFNAEVAGRALNEFLQSYITTCSTGRRGCEYVMLDLLSGEREFVEPTADPRCPFCSDASSGIWSGGVKGRYQTSAQSAAASVVRRTNVAASI